MAKILLTVVLLSLGIPVLFLAFVSITDTWQRPAITLTTKNGISVTYEPNPRNNFSFFQNPRLYCLTAEDSFLKVLLYTPNCHLSDSMEISKVVDTVYSQIYSILENSNTVDVDSIKIPGRIPKPFSVMEVTTKFWFLPVEYPEYSPEDVADALERRLFLFQFDWIYQA